MPDWLLPYHQPDTVARVLEDTREMIERVHSAAGLDELEIQRIGGSVTGFTVRPEDLERIRQDC